jgi:hypothetical protein
VNNKLRIKSVALIVRRSLFRPVRRVAFRSQLHGGFDLVLEDEAGAPPVRQSVFGAFLSLRFAGVAGAFLPELHLGVGGRLAVFLQVVGFVVVHH